VTDASVFQDKLYVVGYTKNASVYLMVFEKDETGNLFFNKPPKNMLWEEPTILDKSKVLRQLKKEFIFQESDSASNSKKYRKVSILFRLKI
jgi:hypothetical protein